MSAQLYREAFQNEVLASFEPGKRNKFQTWLTDEFLKDTKPFYIRIRGEKLEVSRDRVAAKAIEVGLIWKEANGTSTFPKGFFRLEVIPALIADFER